MMAFSPKILHTLLATNELQCEFSNYKPIAKNQIKKKLGEFNCYLKPARCRFVTTNSENDYN